MPFIFVLMVSLLLFSCEKEVSTTPTIAQENWKKISRPASFRSSNHQQRIHYSGSSIHAPSQTVSGNFSIGNLSDGATGQLLIDGTLAQNLHIDITQNHIDKIDIYRTSDNSYVYTKIFDNQDVYLNNVVETKDHLTGQLVTNSGTVDIDVEITSNARVPIPVIIWAVAGALSATTTAVSCAVMRATAQSGCQNRYHQCISTCPSAQCNYKYISGLCGGTCEVECAQ